MLFYIYFGLSAFIHESVGEEYGEFDMEDLSEAIEKLPRYKLLEVMTQIHAGAATAEVAPPLAPAT